MSFFCIVGALLCLPPHNVNFAYNYAIYAVPIQTTTTFVVPSIRRI